MTTRRLEHLLVLKTLSGREQDLADVDRLLRARHGVSHDEVRELLAALEAELSETGLVNTYARLVARQSGDST